MAAFGLEELTLEVDFSNLRRIGEDAVLTVIDDRIVVPGVPQLVEDLHVLLDYLVALVPRRQVVLAHRLELALGV